MPKIETPAEAELKARATHILAWIQAIPLSLFIGLMVAGIPVLFCEKVLHLDVGDFGDNAFLFWLWIVIFLVTFPIALRNTKSDKIWDIEFLCGHGGYIEEYPLYRMIVRAISPR